jgi:hypothetical protein
LPGRAGNFDGQVVVVRVVPDGGGLLAGLAARQAAVAAKDLVVAANPALVTAVERYADPDALAVMRAVGADELELARLTAILAMEEGSKQAARLMARAQAAAA